MTRGKQTTLSRKIWMAVTGLFLCLYLVIHLLGNLQLLLPPEQAHIQFNWYAEILTENILIKIIAYVLFASFFVHIIYALIITLTNSHSRNVRYHYDTRKTESKWYTRNMGVLGTIILIFLLVHLRDFWYIYKFGDLPIDEKGRKDLYMLVIKVYSDLWYVLLYVICMIALFYHLLHGFYSAFRTMGLYHPKYVRWIKVCSWAYSLVICVGFAIIPLYVYFLK